jgi:glycosyltransferase involved in cell wall biosynthesis
MREVPEIAGILPTRDRGRLLPRVLAGLWRQSLALERFEVVVVDDGSTDDTITMLEALGQGLPLRVFRQKASGIAAAKNLGVLAARAPILLFMDDDDAPDPWLLETHLEAHRRWPDPAVAVLGHTSLDPTIAASPLMHHVTEVGCQLFDYGQFHAGQVLDHTAFWGGRTSCKRALLVDHGLFDPDFAFGCEDIELGWRLREQGLRVIYEPAARAVMFRAMNFDDFCNRAMQQGRSQWRFHSKHTAPEVRSYCEIDAGLSAWERGGTRLEEIIAQAKALDATASIYAGRDVPLDSRFLAILDTAYREAFFLCRAKGLAEESCC